MESTSERFSGDLGDTGTGGGECECSIGECGEAEEEEEEEEPGTTPCRDFEEAEELGTEAPRVGEGGGGTMYMSSSRL